MSRLRMNTSEISSILRTQHPTCTAAVLVGSAVTRSADCVADIDITAFDPTVSLASDRSSYFRYCDLPVHVVSYHLWHFRIVARDDLLTFFYIREIRKLLRGVVLFDDNGVVESSLREIRHCSVALNLLEPLVVAAGLGSSLPEGSLASRLTFYRSIESMTFAWLHFRLEYTYSKPKWLLEDARSVGSPALDRLFHALSIELQEANDVALLVQRASEQLRAEASPADTQCVNNLADALSLVRADRCAEAVFPLRMALYQGCELCARRLGVRYADLTDIEYFMPELARTWPALAATVRDALLLFEPLSADLRSLWAQAYAEFLRDWQSVRAEARSDG